MHYTIIKKLPSIETIIQEIPLSDDCYQKIKKDREEIKKILAGENNRLLVIVGPCSAWPSEAVVKYAQKLQKFNTALSDVMKIVMRVYIQKPRTTKGWTGPVNQPHPLKEPDIEAGIRYARKMMIDVLKIGLPIADEALFTHNAKGFIDLLSWVAVGARSTENQEHRIFASSIDYAVGLKNPTHGSISVGINSVIAAQHFHTAFFDGHEVRTHGNPFAHLVLRGSNHAPNYSVAHLEEAREYLLQQHVKNPAIIVDASHDNCLFEGKKDHCRQMNVIFETLDAIAEKPKLKALVKGFMIESFLKDGNQKANPDHPEELNLEGLSITDPCLNWENTEKLLITMAEKLRS